jgi:hypothetical protein
VCVCVCFDNSSLLGQFCHSAAKVVTMAKAQSSQDLLKKARRSQALEKSRAKPAYGTLYTLYIQRKFSETSPSYGRMPMVSFHIMSTTEVARVCKSNFCSWEVDTAVSENIRSQ